MPLKSSFTRKLASVFILFAGLISPLILAAPAAASSVSDYNNQVAAQQARINDLQTQLDGAQQKLTDLQNNSNGQAELIATAQTDATNAKDALDSAAADYASKQATYATAYADEQAAETAVNDAVDAVAVASDNVDATFAAYQSAQDATDRAQAAVVAAQNDYANKPIAVGVSPSTGLVADVYTGVSSHGNPPQRADNVYTKCKTITVDNIQANWGGGDILGCGGDYVMIHYHGYITYPTTKQVYFYAQADDGFFMTIGGQTVINDWSLKGCGGNSVGLVSFTANVSKSIDAWFYEWGGGACSTLNYQPLGANGWNVAPASFFSQGAAAATGPDPALKVVLDAKTAQYVAAVAAEETAQQTYTDAANAYDQAQTQYDNANADLSSKQTALANVDALLSQTEAAWQTASDNSALKDAALLSLQTQYKSTFDAINAQAGVVDGLETQLVQAKATLAAIPKPTSPAKVSKKSVTKPVKPTPVTPRGKFVPVPKR